MVLGTGQREGDKGVIGVICLGLFVVFDIV